MKSGKKTSFIKKTIALLIVQILVLLAMLSAIVYMVFRGAERSTGQMITNYMNLYTGELEDVLQGGDKLLGRIVYENSDLRLLQSDSEEERYYASVRTLTMLQNEIATDQDFDALMVTASAYDIQLESFDTAIATADKQAMQKKMMAAAISGAASKWKVGTFGNHDYVYRMYAWQGWSTGVFISLEHYMGTDKNEQIRDLNVVLTNSGGYIYGGEGEHVENLLHTQIADIDTGRFHVEKRASMDDIAVYSVANRFSVLHHMQVGYVLLIAVALLTVIMAAIIIRYIEHAVLKPMEVMQENMTLMRDGNLDIRIAKDFDNIEFTILRNTFNNLMDELMELKIATYEKQISLSEMELRAIRLQIRPHFFLNALTTIAGLSMQEKNTEIQKYIEALSKNIRYMFKAGLHTVPLSEEILHVENYFEMQELKYPGCVFYYTQIAEDVKSWRIPQLLIHTIIENEYKYAVSVEETLTILISAKRIERDGQAYLHLEIEDDGKGYPEAILEEFQNPVESNRGDGTRVGLWSIRRMLGLMYEEDNLFTIRNITPHGCVNVLEIPQNPVNELALDHKKDEIVL